MRIWAGILVWLGLVVPAAMALEQSVIKETVEYLVADSDVIVVGRVVDVENWRTIERARQGPGGWQHIAFQRITVNVEDIVKGQTPKTFTALVPNADGTGVAAYWLNRTPMILCFIHASRWQRDDLPDPLVVRWDSRDVPAASLAASFKEQLENFHAVFPFDRAADAIRHMDLTPVGNGYDLLDAIRAMLVSGGVVQELEHDQPIPQPRFQRWACLWLPPWDEEVQATGQRIGIFAPPGPALARQARTWARSPWPDIRFNAILSYQRMRSPESEAALREMLAREDFFLWHDDEYAVHRWTPRRYPYRGVIHEALRDWGIVVAERPAYEPRVAYRSVWSAGMFVPAALLVGAFFWRPVGGRIRRNRSWLLLALIAFMWMRSHWFADELVLTLGRGEHEIVSARGALQYAWTLEWPASEGWRIGSGRIAPSLPRGVPDLAWHSGGYMEMTPWDPVALSDPLIMTGSAAAATPGQLKHAWGFAYARGDRVETPYDLYRSTDAGQVGPPATSIARLFQVPYWALLALASFPFAGQMFAWRRRRNRRRLGLCENCAYNLFATPDRCPECGHAHG